VGYVRQCFLREALLLSELTNPNTQLSERRVSGRLSRLRRHAGDAGVLHLFRPRPIGYNDQYRYISTDIQISTEVYLSTRRSMNFRARRRPLSLSESETDSTPVLELLRQSPRPRKNSRTAVVDSEETHVGQYFHLT
jgi:hypothetical protein